MTILFAGGELGAFIGTDSNAIESTTSNNYDSAFSRCAIKARDTTQYVYTPVFAATTDAPFIHFTTGQADVGGGATPLCVLVTSGGTEVFRLRANPLQMQYWNGAAWVNQGASVSADITNSRQTIDLYVVGGVSGSATLFIGGSERLTVSADYSNVANIDRLRMYGFFPHQPYTQVIVATVSTIGWRLTTVPPTGAGATTDWTGGYTEIDETVINDADFINSATANQVELFTHGTTIPAGYTVRAVVVTARAKKDVSGPANIQLALRSAGTTYFTSSQALSLGYGAHVGIWETDPATSAEFTTSAIAALQFGVKSIT